MYTALFFGIFAITMGAAVYKIVTSGSGSVSGFGLGVSWGR